MIRHVVLFRFTPDSTSERHETMLEALRGLPAVIPEIRAYSAARDLGLAEGNWQAGVVADFEDVDDWRTYREHPEHRRIIDEQITPMLLERSSVQFEL